MNYRITQDYKSGLGVFEKGQKVDLDDVEAGRLENDCPGLLKPTPGTQDTDGKTNPVTEGDGDQVDATIDVGQDEELAEANRDLDQDEGDAGKASQDAARDMQAKHDAQVKQPKGRR